ncbi:hypothetical protein I2485_01925 [Nesterenkonia sp. E16_7]|uniref:hypothetical protein n=1 Tax=unclassified Nesterenkonia TaxID=2629769 RepID=UPI001A935E92|nr:MULTISPECIES: hypothetical protein [unclassified Nesterenkonia]MBO0596366.1 hypothetical protein [Nesterenkonia sp. E16_10]MBO0597406.1 hypothetical protein [Nesterenkonia sp. E16_7]
MSNRPTPILGPTQFAIEGYADITRATGRAAATGSAPRRSVDLGAEPMDVISTLRGWYREDVAEAEARDDQLPSPTQPEQATRALDNLANAAVEIAVLLGEDEDYSRPLDLLHKVGNLLAAANLPHPGDYTAGDGYRIEALHAFGNALDEARSTP